MSWGKGFLVVGRAKVKRLTFNITHSNVCLSEDNSVIISERGGSTMARDKSLGDKPHLNIGTIGHSDHGQKMLFCGAVRRAVAVEGRTAQQLSEYVDGLRSHICAEWTAEFQHSLDRSRWPLNTSAKLTRGAVDLSELGDRIGLTKKEQADIFFEVMYTMLRWGTVPFAG
ncbi:MAG: hypothetical protein WC309_02605 [Candidatus Paceibacterota bacterium]